MGGYGSDKRYESSALINYFKNKRKISVLASANNINSTGFRWMRFSTIWAAAEMSRIITTAMALMVSEICVLEATEALPNRICWA